MKHSIKTTMMIALALLAATSAAWAIDLDYGASAANAALSGSKAFTIVDMLRWAAEDEYMARGEYEAIMKRFGTMRPYENIMAAEEQHLAWLKAEYKARGIAFPADGSASHVVIPADLRQAAQAGVDAEIANIQMYERFLSRPELAKPENAGARTLFEQLKRASENHLRAFRTQLSRY
jgi:hypothetical protein